MKTRILCLFVFLGLLSVKTLRAQNAVPQNWKAQKIKGTRHIPYAPAAGRPYLNDRFSSGEIELADGFRFEDLKLRYSSYRDEIIYYNPEIPAQIVIDKATLTGFSLIDTLGTKRIFRLQYYGGYSPGMHFFEVLVDGEIKLLAYRKVSLEVCTPYNDLTGKLNNTIYQEAYSYYLYHPGKGYELIRINKNSLLSKFSQPDQKQVKIILRKNGVKINGEESFVRAWRLIDSKKVEPICKFEVSDKLPEK
jgi:hypothetical protein